MQCNETTQTFVRKWSELLPGTPFEEDVTGRMWRFKVVAAQVSRWSGQSLLRFIAGRLVAGRLIADQVNRCCALAAVRDGRYCGCSQVLRSKGGGPSFARKRFNRNALGLSSARNTPPESTGASSLQVGTRRLIRSIGECPARATQDMNAGTHGGSATKVDGNSWTNGSDLWGVTPPPRRLHGYRGENSAGGARRTASALPQQSAPVPSSSKKCPHSPAPVPDGPFSGDDPNARETCGISRRPATASQVRFLRPSVSSPPILDQQAGARLAHLLGSCGHFRDNPVVEAERRGGALWSSVGPERQGASVGPERQGPNARE